jgi:uncharacterized membrane protein YfcA
MSLTIYIVSALSVFFFSGLLALAGLCAAFIFVPLYYCIGVPLAEAVPTALLLNVVSLMFATVYYYRGGHFTCFIQEYTAAIRLPEFSFPSSIRAGKSSFFLPE